VIWTNKITPTLYGKHSTYNIKIKFKQTKEKQNSNKIQLWNSNK
jgi:hypothetical protein